MSEVKQIVVELLAQMGSSREAKLYLQRFGQAEETKFAVIKVGGGTLLEHLDQLAAALGFLHVLGLYPIIIHGAGPQLDASLEEAGIRSEKSQGMRVTSDEIMTLARPVMYRENTRLVEALEARGVKARGIVHGVFRCSYLDREKLGLVGAIEQVDLDAIRSAVKSHALPIVSCLGESPSGQVMNINADVATRELAKVIQPQKIIFITPTGGLLDANESLINTVNLSSDYDGLMAESWVHSGMRLKLQQIKAILDALPNTASVSITSAQGLTRELFTHTGCGTLVRRGEKIRQREHLQAAEKQSLVALLETAFQRRLGPEWVSQLDDKTVYISESGRAAAVVARGVQGIPYLDKFAVSGEAQGEGLGAILWQKLQQRYPQLYWRSRWNNPFTQWYYGKAEVSRRQGEWVAFTTGIESAQRTYMAMEDALERKSGWVEAAA